MNPAYAVKDTADVFSPALLFYKDLIRRNIARAVEVAGNPARLRPHVKTHKTREIVRLEKDAGITKHKCATPAEADFLRRLLVGELRQGALGGLMADAVAKAASVPAPLVRRAAMAAG